MSIKLKDTANITATSASSATSATKLQTARTINGTSFDGSANITTANWGTARNIQIGNTAKSVNGSGNVSWSLSEIGAAPASHTHSYAPISHEQDYAGTNSNTYIAYPKDGRYRSGSNNASVTGYLKITLPQTWTSTMMKFDVDVFNYVDNETMTYTISGYNFSNGANSAWHNVTAACKTHQSNSKRNLSVRFGHDGTKCAIYIGEASTVWAYPQVTVKNITVAYSNYTLTSWNAGWVVGYTTTLGTISKTVTNPYVGNGGNAATATTLQTARTINGTSFNGSANITTANWGTARNLQIGNTAKSVNGSANVTWSLSEIGAAASNHTHSYLPLSGGTLTSSIKFSGGGYNNHAIRMEAGDANGAFIGIGAGGLTVIGSGESTNAVRTALTNGADETMIVASDQTIRFLTGVQNGYSSAKEVSINAAGVINAPQGMTGNASTATKLQTARSINGTSFDGSGNITTANWGTARNLNGVSVNGSTNYTIPVENYYCNVGDNNTNLYHRILTTDIATASWVDKSLIIVMHSGYNGGGFGIAKITFRTDDISSAASSKGEIKWLVRNGFAANALVFNFVNQAKNACMDVFYKSPGTYAGMTWYVLSEGGRGGAHSKQWTKYNTNASGTNAYTEANMKTLRTYTSTLVSATDAGHVSTANSASTLSTARTINGTSFNGSANITTANWGTARTITIGSTGKSVNGSGNVSWSLSEIGAAPSSHTHSSLKSTDPVRPTSANVGVVGDRSLSMMLATSNMTTAKPSAGDGYILNFNWDNTGGYTSQLYVQNSSNPKIQVRGMSGGTWGNWNTVYATNNKPTLSEIGAIGADTSGNYVGMTAPDGNKSNWIRTTTSGIIPSNQNKESSIGTSSWQFKAMYATTFYGALSGNASTATKLQTARSINGTNFDGTGNITTANWGAARNIQIGNTAKSVNGSANVSWSLSEIGAAPASSVGTLSSLKTSAKGNLVDAINEVFQSADSARSSLVSAIGSPLTSTDTLASIATKLQSKKQELGTAAAKVVNGVSSSTNLNTIVSTLNGYKPYVGRAHTLYVDFNGGKTIYIKPQKTNGSTTMKQGSAWMAMIKDVGAKRDYCLCTNSSYGFPSKTKDANNAVTFSIDSSGDVSISCSTYTSKTYKIILSSINATYSEIDETESSSYYYVVKTLEEKDEEEGRKDEESNC